MNRTAKRCQSRTAKKVRPERFCAYCRNGYELTRTDKRYCCGTCRRDAFDQRVTAMLDVLVGQFGSYGLRRDHIAGSDLDRLYKVMDLLHYHYSELIKQWVRAA